MNIRLGTNGDLILEAAFQGGQDHFARIVPFNLSEHIRQIVREELNASPKSLFPPVVYGTGTHGKAQP